MKNSTVILFMIEVGITFKYMFFKLSELYNEKFTKLYYNCDVIGEHFMFTVKITIRIRIGNSRYLLTKL